MSGLCLVSREIAGIETCVTILEVLNGVNRGVSIVV